MPLLFIHHIRATFFKKLVCVHQKRTYSVVHSENKEIRIKGKRVF